MLGEIKEMSLGTSLALAEEYKDNYRDINAFKIKTHLIGLDSDGVKELKVLNRIIRYTQTGIEFEADQLPSEELLKKCRRANKIMPDVIQTKPSQLPSSAAAADSFH